MYPQRKHPRPFDKPGDLAMMAAMNRIIVTIRHRPDDRRAAL